MPKPDFSTLTHNENDSYSHPITKLEEKLQNIFVEAFHLEASPDVNISFGRLGGTSLGAMRALSFIRQKIYSQMNINLLFTNPSVRQLAKVLQPLITDNKHDLLTEPITKDENEASRPIPSIISETIGILFLITLWILPILLIISSSSIMLLFIVPFIHLFSYVLCKNLLFPLGIAKMEDVLFSSKYYYWWFLQRMWTLNTFWLNHLQGTSFYNAYLRLCGSRIGHHANIDTSFIDTPDLLDVGDSTYVGDEAVLSSLTYYDRTFKLHTIRIGSNCSIGCRTVLHNGVEIEERVVVKAMSPVTGHISSGSIIDGPSQQIDKDQSASDNDNNALSKSQVVFQLISILAMLSVHTCFFTLIFSCLPSIIPLFIRLAIVWLAWSVGRLILCVVLLKIIIGEAQPGIYPLNSWYFLRKLWLRQLVVRSLAFSFVSHMGPYHLLFPRLFQWLGAQIDEPNDIRISQAHFLLAFPTNLVHIEQGVTVNGFVLFIPFNVTTNGQCKVNRIRLGRKVQLGNHCTVQPGANIVKQTLVGTLTRIDEETNVVTDDDNDRSSVMLGIPARLMPFQQLSLLSMSTNNISPSIYSDMACTIGIRFLVNVILSFVLIYDPLLLLIYFLAAEHFISVFFYAIPRELSLTDRINPWLYRLTTALTLDFFTFITPLLGGTQWLVILLRRLKASIGQDVVIGEINAVEDWKHVTIESHVRVSATAKIQVRKSW
ncbi:unnamed protein product [Rotaria sp. Silwood1]|nr:unnamed protein product [Rotaria sp. Silwood1]CAF1312914.1 unnamed protein product [Rotaria sp. Silwood1]CAF3550072.1 unnamed protein product [Rotaria sp. Silwood1]CAF3557703.1 unnamed protein product [Rotaria sp. Silwood1]